VPTTMALIAGLMIGEQTIEGDDGRSFRVVVIDPTLNREAEDAAGALLIDTIDHFIASHVGARAGCPQSIGRREQWARDRHQRTRRPERSGAVGGAATPVMPARRGPGRRPAAAAVIRAHAGGCRDSR